MENMPWVFCGAQERHHRHGTVCPGTGLCARTEDHKQHLVLEGSLAPFWCLADWTQRQPYKGEQEQRQQVQQVQQVQTETETGLDPEWIEVLMFGEPQRGTFKVFTEVPLPGDLVIDDLSEFMAQQMDKIRARGQTP